MQDERKLVRSKEYPESRVALEAVVEDQADMFVLALDGVDEVRRVQRANEIQAVAGVVRYLDNAFRLRTWLLVPPDHVKIHHRTSRSKRTQRMLRHVIRTQQPTLLRRKHNDKD